MKELMIKYKEMLLYLVFGGCTTLVNIITYQLCYAKWDVSNVVSTCIAWVVAVIFAFVTNKLFVFESKSFQMDVLVHELISFFSCRFLTGILDVVIMYISVDLMHFNALLWKIIANILVIILNYIASKLIIFSKRGTK